MRVFGPILLYVLGFHHLTETNGIAAVVAGSIAFGSHIPVPWG